MEITNKDVPLADITLDARLQPRETLNVEAIEEYAAQYATGGVMPPVRLIADGQALWLADGFHRYHAVCKAGLDAINAEVSDGRFRDALLIAAGANASHGLRRSNADKRRAVEMLLTDAECAGWSNEQIARHCQVGPHLVAEMRGYLCESGDDPGTAISAKTEITDPATRTVTRGGVTYRMKVDNIGRRVPARPAPPPPASALPWSEANLKFNDAGLLPCPFCGSLNSMLAHNAEENCHIAICPDDDCLSIGPRRETAEEALEAWNMRA